MAELLPHIGARLCIRGQPLVKATFLGRRADKPWLVQWRYDSGPFDEESPFWFHEIMRELDMRESSDD